MADTSARTSEAEVEHFSGTILKRNADGVEVISSTLEPGETLLSGNAQSEVEEAQPEPGQKTTPTLSRAAAQQDNGEDGPQPVQSPEPTKGAEEQQQTDVDKTAVTEGEKTDSSQTGATDSPELTGTRKTKK